MKVSYPTANSYTLIIPGGQQFELVETKDVIRLIYKGFQLPHPVAVNGSVIVCNGEAVSFSRGRYLLQNKYSPNQKPVVIKYMWNTNDLGWTLRSTINYYVPKQMREVNSRRCSYNVTFEVKHGDTVIKTTLKPGNEFKFSEPTKLQGHTNKDCTLDVHVDANEIITYDNVVDILNKFVMTERLEKLCEKVYCYTYGMAPVLGKDHITKKLNDSIRKY